MPAPFRTVLASQSFNGIIVYPSFVNACVEACGMSRIEKMYARIESLDPFSEERDAFATAILGGSMQLPFDGEGRVVLPEALLAQAGITTQGIFIGKGETFEIWEPVAFAAHEAAARALAKQRRMALPSNPKAGV